MSIPLSGIVPPLATPLSARDRLDHEGCDRLLEHVASAGVAGVFILGTTGEAPGLSYRLRGEVIDHVCSWAARRLPVLVGVTDTCAEETMALAGRAARAGASAIVLAPPFYFGLTQSELLGYLERIVPALPLPVYLYNIPSLARPAIEPETLRVAASIPQIAGFKDSSGDMEYFRRAIDAVAHRPDFAVFCGPEELLAEAMRSGASGGVTGGANLFPRLYTDMHDACGRGDEERVARLQQVIDTVSRSIYGLTPAPSSYLRGLKCALEALGICANVMAEPYEPYGGPTVGSIRKSVDEIQSALDQLEIPTAPLALD
jgi:4-hydroxy-tetrahydrodipicolinate synthase